MEYDFYGDEEVDEDAPMGIPKGERFLRVIEWEDAGQTRNGDPSIKLTIQDTETGRTCLHWLNLLPKGNAGHGMAKKWLKTLSGVSADGQSKPDPDTWLGKVFKANVYYEKDNQYAKIMTSSLKSLDENENIPEKPVLDEEIGF